MNQYGQRGRQDQRPGSAWDEDDRDELRGGGYGGYGGGREYRDDYRRDYRSHGDLQSQGGYRGGYQNEGWGADRGRSMSGNYGGGSFGGQDSYSGSGNYGSASGYGQGGSGRYRDQGPRHEGWREDSGRRDYGRMAGTGSDSYANSLGEHYGGTHEERDYRGSLRSGSGQSEWQSQGRQQHYDPDYEQWRHEQMRTLDNDYHGWRQERYQKFSEDFNKWRSERSTRQGAGVSGAASSGGSTQEARHDTKDATRYGQGGNAPGSGTGTHDDRGLTASGSGSLSSASLPGATSSASDASSSKTK